MMVTGLEGDGSKRSSDELQKKKMHKMICAFLNPICQPLKKCIIIFMVFFLNGYSSSKTSITSSRFDQLVIFSKIV